MLRAILRIIRRAISAIGRGAAAFVGSLLSALGGLGAGAPAVPSEEPEEVIDEQVAELREKLDSSRGAVPPVPDALGERIHAYAAAEADGRAGFDFTGVPDDVSLTLLSLSESQLARLALAGPVICGRWACGARTGLVSVPLPALPTAPVADEAPAETACSGPAPAPAAAAA